MASAEGPKIEVPKALRSDTEAPKALKGVECGEHVSKTHTFGHRTILV